ncbi:MAG: T9SS type A sorting domain-containing protein [Bacteroidales bacterium]|nr:T9SS type A sorting domain-containing protein [Bacteroidales bacterium]
MKKALFSLVAMLLFAVSGIAQNTTFTKVTSASGLEAGAMYLIVGNDEELGDFAMGYQKQNNRHAVAVTDDGGNITVTPAVDPYSEGDANQFMLGGSANAWTFYDPLREGYLYAASSSSNQLKTQSTNNANGEWSIVFNADGTAEVVAQGENSRNNMRFNPNNGTPLFSAYAETSTVDTRVCLYKAGGTVEPDPEPSNYPTNFTATVDGTDVTLTWTDAVGEQLPHRYVVIAALGAVTPPTDGIAIADSDMAKNVNYGTQTVTFSGLQGGGIYHFGIFPYTNSGANIDYKTDGSYPTATVATENIEYLLYEEFDEELGVFTTYDAYGDQTWHQGSHQGTTYANMNGYAEQASHQNEDWLIGYVEVPDLTFTDIFMEFRTAMKFDGDPLRVAISMDYDGQSDPSDFEWEDITDAFDYSTGDYEWVESGELNVIDYAENGSFYIAFIYTSSDEAASSWEIDYVKVWGKFTAAVNDNEMACVSLYPNPAREQVSFTLDSDAQINIFDVTGRMVREMNVAAGNAQLNVSELENGVYFVNFRYANGTTAVAKFVKF